MARPKVLDTLQEFREGAMVQDIDDALANVVTACRETGKPAKLTITIIARPVKQSGGTVLAFDDDVKVKLPPVEKAGTMLFASEDGILTRDNPKQPKLPLRQVEPFRPAAASTGTEAAAPAGKD